MMNCLIYLLNKKLNLNNVYIVNFLPRLQMRSTEFSRGTTILEREDWYEDDPLKVGRGILYGVVLGIVIWTIILGSIVLALRLSFF